MDIKNCSIHKHNEYEFLIQFCIVHGELPGQTFQLTDIFRLCLTKIMFPCHSPSNTSKTEERLRPLEMMPKIEGMVLKADELQQSVKQANHANSGALKQRKHSFSSGTHRRQTLTHTQCRSLQGNSKCLLWRDFCYLELFQAFPVLWFLQLLHPSGPSGEMKFTDAQALTVTGPQKAAFAKGWNTLADTLPPLFFPNKKWR